MKKTKKQMRRTRVLLVASEPMFRAGLKAVLEADGGFRVCGEAGDARSARGLCARVHPAMVVLVLPLAGATDFGLVRELSHLRRGVQTVVVVPQGDPETVRHALGAGARGLVRRADEAPALCRVCRDVRCGRRDVSEEVKAELLHGLGRGAGGARTQGGGDVRGLSTRELAVLSLMGQDLGPKAIAGQLGVSIKTVETHECRMREKLRLANAAQLRSLARQWAVCRAPELAAAA
jgi:DNA-binding NarL/FixJ family response regulator